MEGFAPPFSFDAASPLVAPPLAQLQAALGVAAAGGVADMAAASVSGALAEGEALLKEGRFREASRALKKAARAAKEGGARWHAAVLQVQPPSVHFEKYA